jgi:1-acyl-sn-glycerol-3-phosphate acyltransferase
MPFLVSVRKLIYSFEKILWSIYFLITLALIGLIMGYLVTGTIFLLSWIVQVFNPELSLKLMLLAEYIQCWSIYFLLKIQPWFNCKNNFQSIYGFYDVYKTRKIMVVANHRSNLDTFILISLIPGLRGMAKKSLFYNIFFAPIMFLIGFVPVDKGNLKSFIKGINLVKTKILMRNRPALVFPETTRCQKNAQGIGKFSDAVFKAAIESNALVLPILIQGTDQILGRGDFLINPHASAEFTIYNPIVANKYANESDLSGDIKKLFVDRILCS